MRARLREGVCDRHNLLTVLLEVIFHGPSGIERHSEVSVTSDHPSRYNFASDDLLLFQIDGICPFVHEYQTDSIEI